MPNRQVLSLVSLLLAIGAGVGVAFGLSQLIPTFHTTAELRGLVADLPLAQLRRHDPRRQEARRAAARLSVQIHLAGYLAMVAIVLTVWLAVGLVAGAWYFWPIWPILGAGIGVLGHALPVRAMPWPQCRSLQ
jgi:fatty acid desaturase